MNQFQSWAEQCILSFIKAFVAMVAGKLERRPGLRARLSGRAGESVITAASRYHDVDGDDQVLGAKVRVGTLAVPDAVQLYVLMTVWSPEPLNWHQHTFGAACGDHVRAMRAQGR